MDVQRYLLKEGKGDIFDKEFKTLYTISFQWHISRKRIGIYPIGDFFTEDFLTTKDKLFVRRNPPVIVRAQNVSDLRQSLRRNSIDYGVKQLHKKPLERLLNILLSKKQTHCYFSSRKENSTPDVLTFSLTKPPQELYVPGKKMPIEHLEQVI